MLQLSCLVAALIQGFNLDVKGSPGLLVGDKIRGASGDEKQQETAAARHVREAGSR